MHGLTGELYVCVGVLSLSLSLSLSFSISESRGLWERKRERGQTRRHLCQLSRQREIVTWAIRRSSASPLFSSSLRHLLFLHLSMCKRSSTARRPTHTTHAAASPCNTRIPPASWGRKHARGALTLLLARVLQLHWRRWADAMRGNDCPRWRASRRLGARKTHAGGAQRGGGAGSMCACLLSPRYSTLASTTYCWCTALGSPLFSLSLSLYRRDVSMHTTYAPRALHWWWPAACVPASQRRSLVRPRSRTPFSPCKIQYRYPRVVLYSVCGRCILYVYNICRWECAVHERRGLYGFSDFAESAGRRDQSGRARGRTARPVPTT